MMVAVAVDYARTKAGDGDGDGSGGSGWTEFGAKTRVWAEAVVATVVVAATAAIGIDRLWFGRGWS